MDRSDQRYQAYISILREELIPAMGCTEPIAIAYCAARAREILGELPERVVVGASGSMIKNVKSVIVPHTGHRKGIEVAAAAGIVAGRADLGLEVISRVSTKELEEIGTYVMKTPITVQHIDNGPVFDICITVFAGGHSALVRIANYHTNIVHEEKDGKVLLDIPVEDDNEEGLTDRSCLTMEGIWDFIQSVDVDEIRPILEPQVKMNMAIANEGMHGDYGANIGKVMEKLYGDDDIRIRARAYAAAGSDARMNGCELPVVINSGSGNQGITACVPVVVYAKKLSCTEEKMYRALALSNLTAIHQKTRIGRLSAYCGAVNAGAGAGAGIAYLCGGGYEEIIHTVVNALAVVSGIVCDGAKASCAAKIASAVEAGIFGYEMYRNGQEFHGGDGIVTKGVEETIANVGKLAHDGMKETNEEIIKIMVGGSNK